MRKKSALRVVKSVDVTENGQCKQHEIQEILLKLLANFVNTQQSWS